MLVLRWLSSDHRFEVISVFFGADEFINQGVRAHYLLVLCLKLDGPLLLEQLSVRSVLTVELLKDLLLFIQCILENLLVRCHQYCLFLLLL